MLNPRTTTDNFISQPRQRFFVAPKMPERKPIVDVYRGRPNGIVTPFHGTQTQQSPAPTQAAHVVPKSTRVRHHSPADHQPIRVSKSQVLNRQVVAKTHTSPAKKRKLPKLSVKKNAKANLILASAIMLLIFGGWVGLMGLRTNRHVQAQVDGLSKSAQDGGLPDETEPDKSTFGSYVVDPSMPRFIRIAKTDTYARVKRMGVDTDNQLQAPMNTHDAGWYENSAKPGDAGGAMLIDGHVGFTKDGIFGKLKTVVKGDKIEIERGDGKKFTYTVVDMQNYDADNVDMKKALVSADPTKPGLNLITCTGKLTKEGTSYDQRLMVFAVQD